MKILNSRLTHKIMSIFKYLSRRRVLGAIATLSLLCLFLVWIDFDVLISKEAGLLHENIGITLIPKQDSEFVVLVLSSQDRYENREMVRRTWAERHTEYVRFILGIPNYPNSPPVSQSNTGFQSDKELKGSISEENQMENDVIFTSTNNTSSSILNQLKAGLDYAIQYKRARWVLIVNDETIVYINDMEDYLGRFFQTKDMVIIISKTLNNPVQKRHIANVNDYIHKILQHPYNHVLSYSSAKYISQRLKRNLSISGKSSQNETEINNALRIIVTDRIADDGNCNNLSYLVIGNLRTPTAMKTCYLEMQKRKNENITQNFKTISENPAGHLHFLRFDVIFKLVYAYFYSVVEQVPPIIEQAYVEHIRTMNSFKENCDILPEWWFDGQRHCKTKASKFDFLQTFQQTLDSIKQQGFLSNISQIPTDKYGYILNGAHRLSASIILSKNATFQYFNITRNYNYDYEFFQTSVISAYLSELVVLEWMRIQVKLPFLTSQITVLSIFSDDYTKDIPLMNIVKTQCAKDRGILFQSNLAVNKYGMNQLITHMYGYQPWLKAKIHEITSLFKASNFKIRFMFFFGKSMDELKKCKYSVRKLYNHASFKSSAHIPDTPEENLILAEMILNPNSRMFLNYAKNGEDCKGITSEIARRSSLKPIKTLPGIFIGRDDVMIDSGSVLHFFDLRKRTDIDIIFLKGIDKTLLGKENGMRIEAHAFKSNAISSGRPWGQEHLSGNIKTPWDLFYDPHNFGFCYGIKFVSLEQLIRYKRKRNEPVKDPRDINLMDGLLNKINNITV